MLRQGPIPHFVHGVLEYVAAAAFIVVPLLLDFESGTAKAVSIVTGVVLLIVAATTVSPTGIVNQIPVAAHAVLDFLLAFFLIAAPFLFGFSDETEPLVFFVALGVVHLLVTIATRFVREPAAAGDRGGGRAAVTSGDPASASQAPSEPAPPAQGGDAAPGR